VLVDDAFEFLSDRCRFGGEGFSDREDLVDSSEVRDDFVGGPSTLSFPFCRGALPRVALDLVVVAMTANSSQFVESSSIFFETPLRPLLMLFPSCTGSSAFSFPFFVADRTLGSLTPFPTAFELFPSEFRLPSNLN